MQIEIEDRFTNPARAGILPSQDVMLSVHFQAGSDFLLGDLRLLVPMKGVIDVDAERSRLEKQRDKVRADLARTSGKLGNESFVNNAPADVVTQERQRAVEFEKTIAQLDEQRAFAAPGTELVETQDQSGRGVEAGRWRGR